VLFVAGYFKNKNQIVGQIVGQIKKPLTALVAVSG